MLFDLVEESKALIATDSVSQTGTRALVDRLAPYCRALGFHVTLQPASDKPDEPEINLIAHTAAPGSPDLCPGGLALVTHLDTVPGGDPTLWTETSGDPLKPTIVEDKIYGLGSADTKLDILCKLLAIEEVGLENIKIPLALIGTYGEERSLGGARLLRETGIVKPKFALVGEPCELKAVLTHKGIFYLRAVLTGVGGSLRAAPLQTKSFRGKSAHGSMPHLGDNAVEKAIRWIGESSEIEVVSIRGGTVHNVVPEACEVAYVRRVSESQGSRINDFVVKFLQLMDVAREYLKTHANADFVPPHTSDNIGVIRTIEGGEVPEVEIEFDFRLIPETNVARLLEIFQELGQGVPGARVELIRTNPPMNTLKDSEIARRVAQAQAEVGLPQLQVAKSGNTEGAIFNDIGAESVVTGPGKSVGNIHAPNEHNEIPQLRKAVEFYAAFLRRFC